MVTNLVASIGAGLLLGRAQVRLRLLLIPLLLLVTIGPRLELLGLAVGLIILAIPIERRASLVWAQEIAAASAAVFAGFRVEFVTAPSGGFIYITHMAVPLTVLWVVLMLRLRESLRQALPRTAVQLAIDLTLVVDACLLSLAWPGTDGIARLLPVILLGLVLTSFVTLGRGKDLGLLHRGVAFSIALYGIGGVMKGAMSLALLLPLAFIAFPMMISPRAFIAPILRRGPSVRIPTLRGMSEDGFILSSLLLTSALSLGVVLAVHRSVELAMLSLLVLPLLILLWGIRRLWDRVIGWNTLSREEERIGLFGVRISNVTLEEATDASVAMLRSGGSHIIVTPNTVSLMRAQADARLLEAYDRADLVVADGVGLVWASRLLGVPLPERVPGIALAEELLQRACTHASRVFLLGGREGVAFRAKERLLKRFPGLDIVGVQHGYFSNEDEVMDSIRAARPDLLLVGMGVPRQELLMLRVRQGLDVRLMIGIGGALDVFAGERTRAPQLWQRVGLEWLYRLFQEPRRMRDVLLIPRFMLLVLCARGVLSIDRFLSLSEGLD